jgi:hypothetical protein
MYAQSSFPVGTALMDWARNVYGTAGLEGGMLVPLDKTILMSKMRHSRFRRSEVELGPWHSPNKRAISCRKWEVFWSESDSANL